MSAKLRRNRHKDIKWIDSRFSWRYKRELAQVDLILNAQAAMISSQGLANCNQMRFATGGRAERALAIGETVVRTYEAVAKVFGQRKVLIEPLNKRWRSV